MAPYGGRTRAFVRATRCRSGFKLRYHGRALRQATEQINAIAEVTVRFAGPGHGGNLGVLGRETNDYYCLQSD